MNNEHYLYIELHGRGLLSKDRDLLIVAIYYCNKNNFDCKNRIR